DVKDGVLVVLVDGERGVDLDGRHAGLGAPVGERDLAFFGGRRRRERGNGAYVLGPRHDVDAAHRATGDVDDDEGAVPALEIHRAVHPVPFRDAFAGDCQDVRL